MKKQIKQRLIGGLVLVALVAIFLPLLFHSTPPSATLSLSTEAPEAPPKPSVQLHLPEHVPAVNEAAEEQLSARLNVDADAAALSEADKQSAEQTPAVTQHMLKVASLPPAESPEVVSTPDSANQAVKSAAPAQPELIDAAPSADAPKVGVHAAGAPAQAEEASKTVMPKSSPDGQAVSSTAALPAVREGWVLQVGTFSQKSNADRLLKVLQEDGLTAYTQDGVSGSRQVTRVYVGPARARLRMEVLQKRIKEKWNISSVIRPYKA